MTSLYPRPQVRSTLPWNHPIELLSLSSFHNSKPARFKLCWLSSLSAIMSNRTIVKRAWCDFWTQRVVFQLSDTVVISLDEVEDLAIEKLLEYIYLGQTTVNKNIEKSVSELVDRLGLDVTLDPAPVTDSSSENEVTEVAGNSARKSSPKKGRKPGSSAKKGGRSVIKLDQAWGHLGLVFLYYPGWGTPPYTMRLIPLFCQMFS